MTTLTSYQPIKDKFQLAKDTQTPILIQTTGITGASSVVVTLDYVGDYFCKGTSEKRVLGDFIRIPYTISYAEVYAGSGNEKDKIKPKTRIFFKGDNPFE